MNIEQFLTEYYELSESRRKAGLEALFAEISSDIKQYDGFILDILELASDLEADDYFGTEGLDV